MFHNGHRPFSNKRDVKKMIQDLSLHSICYIRPIPPSAIQQSRQQVPAIPPSNNSTSQPDPAKEIERLNNELKKKEDEIVQLREDLEMAEGIVADLREETTIEDLYKLIREKYDPEYDFFNFKCGHRLNMYVDAINESLGHIGVSASLPFPFPELRMT